MAEFKQLNSTDLFNSACSAWRAPSHGVLCAGRLKFVGGKFVATSFDLYLTMEVAQLGDLFAFK